MSSKVYFKISCVNREIFLITKISLQEDSNSKLYVNNTASIYEAKFVRIKEKFTIIERFYYFSLSY